MTEVTIRKTEELRGEVCAPSSKSYTQRMVIAASLSHGSSKVFNPLLSEDTEATIRAVTALGSSVKMGKDAWEIIGPESLHGSKEPIDCGESGATLRFMIPVAALAAEPSVFVLGSGLSKRPIQPLLDALRQLGAEAKVVNLESGNGVRVEGGGIHGGRASIPGDVSSQFVSGLMFACPMGEFETELTITASLESKSYVRMTEEVLSKHGVRAEISEDYGRVRIPAGQEFRPISQCVPGDFSSAAFILAAAAITNSTVTVKNLDYTTKQADKQILGVLKKFGAKGTVCTDSVSIEGSMETLNSVSVDAREIPDLVPICASLACFADGVSVIHDAKRLRLKESDRLASVQSELRKMGADISIDEDGLAIRGPSQLQGATIDPHNDHRIAMACAIAAIRAEGETVIQNAECVRKSYPLFFNDLRKLGADVIGGQFDR